MVDKDLSRRDFLRWTGATAGTLGAVAVGANLKKYIPDLSPAVKAAEKKPSLDTKLSKTNRLSGNGDIYEMMGKTGLSVISDYPDNQYVDETQQIAIKAHEIVEQLGLKGVLKTVYLREGGGSHSEGDGTLIIDVLQWNARKNGKYGIDGANDLIAHEFGHELDCAREDSSLWRRVDDQRKKHLNQMRGQALDGYQAWADTTTDPNRAWNINRVFNGDPGSIERNRAELLGDMFGGTMGLTGGSWEYRGATVEVRPPFRQYFDEALRTIRVNE